MSSVGSLLSSRSPNKPSTSFVHPLSYLVDEVSISVQGEDGSSFPRPHKYRISNQLTIEEPCTSVDIRSEYDDEISVRSHFYMSMDVHFQLFFVLYHMRFQVPYDPPITYKRCSSIRRVTKTMTENEYTQNIENWYSYRNLHHTHTRTLTHTYTHTHLIDERHEFIERYHQNENEDGTQGFRLKKNNQTVNSLGLVTSNIFKVDQNSDTYNVRTLKLISKRKGTSTICSKELYREHTTR